MLLLIGCTGENDNDPRETGKSYGPNTVGRETIYDVYTLRWNDFNTSPLPDTIRFQMRELVESKFTDNTGQQANRLMIYTRKHDSDNWLPFRVNSSLVSNFAYERSEDNVRLVKLVFPLGTGKAWNGNMYNVLDAEQLKYTGVFVRSAVGKFLFDSTVVVERRSDVPENDSNAVYTCTRKEIYAKGLGMVYREADSINFTGGINHDRWYGTRTRITLIGHN